MLPPVIFCLLGYDRPVTVKTVHSPGVDSHLTLPPYDVTIAFTSARPSPLPGSDLLPSPRQKRLKTCGMSDAGMPGPVLATESENGSYASRTSVLPPFGVNLSVLSRRFPSIC